MGYSENNKVEKKSVGRKESESGSKNTEKKRRTAPKLLDAKFQFRKVAKFGGIVKYGRRKYESVKFSLKIK